MILGILEGPSFYPSFLSPLCINLLSKFMKKDPRERPEISLIISNQWFSVSSFISSINPHTNKLLDNSDFLLFKPNIFQKQKNTFIPPNNLLDNKNQVIDENLLFFKNKQTIYPNIINVSNSPLKYNEFLGIKKSLKKRKIDLSNYCVKFFF